MHGRSDGDRQHLELVGGQPAEDEARDPAVRRPSHQPASARLAELVEAQDKHRRRLSADIAMTSRQAQYTERTVSRAAAPKMRPSVAKAAS